MNEPLRFGDVGWVASYVKRIPENLRELTNEETTLAAFMDWTQLTYRLYALGERLDDANRKMAAGIFACNAIACLVELRKTYHPDYNPMNRQMLFIEDVVAPAMRSLIEEFPTWYHWPGPPDLDERGVEKGILPRSVQDIVHAMYQIRQQWRETNAAMTAERERKSRKER